MSLTERLQEIAEKAKERIPAEYREKMKQATGALQRSGQADAALGEGDSLPPFELPNQRGETVSSAELLERGPLVVSFYRGVW